MPNERFRTFRLYCALWVTAHCNPAITIETSVEPSRPATLIETRLAWGATPVQVPLDDVPSPTRIPAMCVPWP